MKSLDLSAIESAPLDAHLKGVPASAAGLSLAEVGRQGWNVLREDLPLPLAVLRSSALEHNIDWMQRFADASGALLCPHGKTTMSPQLFDMQLRRGAWGISAATATQVRTYRRHGVSRILLANQLVGRADMDYVLGELRDDPAFDFYCLVDSLQSLERLAHAAAQASIGRPVQVLLEMGQRGGRTGVRSVRQGVELARALAQAQPLLALRGVEGYEGILESPSEAATLRRIERLTGAMQELARIAVEEKLFSDEPVLLSAGGSAYFDMAARLSETRIAAQTAFILRSGCYVTHDTHWLNARFESLRRRTSWIEELGAGLQPALEIWAYVQSTPERHLAIAAMGKRDCSFDMLPPKPIAAFRSGGRVQRLDGYEVVKLNDHHAYIRTPARSALSVGDLVCFGVAHPCTTFDRWSVLMVVNDRYDVVGVVRTFF